MLRASLYWSCCSPALSQPSSRHSKQSRCGPGLSGSDGTSISWRGSTIPALTEDFLPAVCSRGIFTVLCSMGSLCSVNVSPAFGGTEWAEVGVIYALRVCDAVLLRCSAWDPLTDVQAGGSCHSPVTLSEWWKSGSGSQRWCWRVFMWIDKLNAAAAAVTLQKIQVWGIIYISDRLSDIKWYTLKILKKGTVRIF